MSAGGGTTETTFTTLGVDLSSAFDLADLTANAHGRLGWRHAFGDTTPVSTQRFSGFDAFKVVGVPIVKDTILIEAGFDVDLSTAATFVISYQGEFGNGVVNNGIRADLSISFDQWLRFLRCPAPAAILSLRIVNGDPDNLVKHSFGKH